MAFQLINFRFNIFLLHFWFHIFLLHFWFHLILCHFWCFHIFLLHPWCFHFFLLHPWCVVHVHFFRLHFWCILNFFRLYLWCVLNFFRNSVIIHLLTHFIIFLDFWFKVELVFFLFSTLFWFGYQLPDGGNFAISRCTWFKRFKYWFSLLRNVIMDVLLDLLMFWCLFLLPGDYFIIPNWWRCFLVLLL